MQRLEQYDLLDALVKLNDKSEFSLQEASGDSESVTSMEYKPFELLDHLSAIKMGLDIIKEKTKGTLDKKTMEKFVRIDGEISKMTEKLLETRL
jgi:hypothetical protein